MRTIVFSAFISLRYNDMIEYVRLLAKLGQELTVEERILFSIAYKNVISVKRQAHRSLQTVSDDFDKFEEQVNIVKSTIEMEICNVCSDVINIVRSHILPICRNAETSVFFLKMLGDYYRYLAEVTNKDVHSAEAQSAYSTAVNYASKNLSAINSTRLGLMLNFAVFYYEIEKDTSAALSLAQNAYETAIVELDDDISARDSIMILRLLRDNINMWRDLLSNAADNPISGCIPASTTFTSRSQSSHRIVQSSIPPAFNSPVNPSPVAFSPNHLHQIDRQTYSAQTTPQATPNSRYFTPIDAAPSYQGSPRPMNPSSRQVMMNSPH